jgi:hypothetical protein
MDDDRNKLLRDMRINIMLEMRAKHDTSMMILNSNWIIPGLSLVKKICLCQEADTRDCFFDTRNSPFLADFVCRSRILVCRASTQTKIFLFVLHLCPAKGTKKTVFSFFRINYLICHVCVAAKDQPKIKYKTNPDKMHPKSIPTRRGKSRTFWILA